MSYAYLILRRLLAELWSVIVGAGKEKKKKERLIITTSAVVFRPFVTCINFS